MTKSLYTLVLLLLAGITTKAQQTTAMDFTQSDCYGNMHNLYNTLDSNKVVIIEFFMLNCNACNVAAEKLKAQRLHFDASYPGGVKYYNIGFSDSYTCAEIINWVESDNYNTVPFDSGATQLAYYGGFGMPTVVITAGNNHDVIYTGIGFSTSDTTMIGNAVRDYFAANPLGIKEITHAITMSIYPNPANEQFTVAMNLEQPAADVNIQLVDVTGRVLLYLYNGKLSAGAFQQTFDTNALSSGIYFLRVNANGIFSHNKIKVVR